MGLINELPETVLMTKVDWTEPPHSFAVEEGSRTRRRKSLCV
jgi:hypothetical protein